MSGIFLLTEMTKNMLAIKLLQHRTSDG